MANRLLFTRLLNSPMVRFIVLVVLLSCQPLLSMAQVSLNEFLAGSFDATQLESLKEQRRFVEENGFKSPVLREVEFRMRSNRFENGLTDYRLRFSPINPWEKAANKKYRNAVEEELDVESKFTLNEIFRVRYQLAIRYLNYLELKRIEENNITFYTSLLALVRSQPRRFDVRGVIDLDKALLRSELQLKDLEAEIELMNRSLLGNGSPSSGLLISRDSLVKLDEISTWEQAMGVSAILNSNLELELSQKERATDEADQKIEETQAFSNLGYLQAEYRVDENRNFGENIGMQLAVLLPVTNPDKPDLERRRLNLLKDLYELEEDKEELTSVIIGTQISLKKALAQHALVFEKLIKYDDFKADELGANNDIKVTIELQEMRSFLYAEEISLYCDALNLYIDQLANSGSLVSTPYMNYLSASKAEFDVYR